MSVRTFLFLPRVSVHASLSQGSSGAMHRAPVQPLLRAVLWFFSLLGATRSILLGSLSVTAGLRNQLAGRRGGMG